MKSCGNKQGGGKKPWRDNPMAGRVVKSGKQFLSPWLCAEVEQKNEVNELTRTGQSDRAQDPREVISGT